MTGAVPDPTALRAGSALSRELVRKAIHLTGFAVPGLYAFTPTRLAIPILAAFTATSLVIDYVRHRHVRAGSVFNGIFDPILRAHERDREAKRLNAVSWFFIAALISVWLFPKYVAIASITMALAADAAAALVGTVWGRHRVGEKSLEGSLAFFVTAVIVMSVLPKIGGDGREYVIGAATALVGTLVELTPLPGANDNLTTSLSMATCMWALYQWTFPPLYLQFGV